MGRNYADYAKHFGVPVETIQNLVRNNDNIKHRDLDVLYTVKKRHGISYPAISEHVRHGMNVNDIDVIYSIGGNYTRTKQHFMREFRDCNAKNITQINRYLKKVDDLVIEVNASGRADHTYNSVDVLKELQDVANEEGIATIKRMNQTLDERVALYKNGHIVLGDSASLIDCEPDDSFDDESFLLDEFDEGEFGYGEDPADSYGTIDHLKDTDHYDFT